MSVLPNSLDAEKGALCSFLLEPVKVGGIFAEFGITKEHFHLAPHDLLFQRMMEMWQKNDPIDLITFTQTFYDRNELGMLGVAGPALITEIFTFLPTAANVTHYLEILEEKRILRGIVRLTHDFQSRIENDQTDPENTLASFIERANGISCARVASVSPTPKKMAESAQERAEARYDKRGVQDDVILTGINSIDRTMSGMPKGSYVLVSGKEKSGKSSFAVDNIFLETVLTRKKRGLLISLEMKEPEITDRCLSAIGSISLTNILNGWMTEGEMMNLSKALLRFSEGKFSIRDDLFSLSQIVSAIRQEKAKHPELELVVIDYLQLIDLEKTSKEMLREQVIAQISRTIRRLANELSIVVVMLVQLNEDGAVRESKSVGMDCTAHLRLENSKESNMKWMRVIYQRNGPSNVGIPLSHLGQFVRFEEYTRDDAGEIPDFGSEQKKKKF